MTQPNILLILADDMGFSDIGCFGSEIRTPALDALGTNGLRYTQMYNSARCCPSRAALLTGLNPHQAGVGWMTTTLAGSTDAYQGYLNERCVTIAEVLKGAGYRTFLSGKWHVGNAYDAQRPDTWRAGEPGWPTPTQRGFDDFYGTLDGAGSFWNPHSLMDGESFIRPDSPDFYYTDAIGENAVSRIEAALDAGTPFFGYVAFTAPHWPLHARARRHRPLRGYLPRRLGRHPHRPARDPARCGPRRPPLADQSARHRVLAVPFKPLSRLGGVAHGGLCRPDRPHGPGDRRHRVHAGQAQRARQHADLLPVGQRRLCRIPQGGHARAGAASLQHADSRWPSDARRQPAAPRAGAGGHVHVLRPAVGERVEYAVSPLQVVGARGRHLHTVHRALAERHRDPPRSSTARSTSPTSCRHARRSPAPGTRTVSAIMRFSRWKERALCRRSTTTNGSAASQSGSSTRETARFATDLGSSSTVIQIGGSSTTSTTTARNSTISPNPRSAASRPWRGIGAARPSALVMRRTRRWSTESPAAIRRTGRSLGSASGRHDDRQWPLAAESVQQLTGIRAAPLGGSENASRAAEPCVGAVQRLRSATPLVPVARPDRPSWNGEDRIAR